MAKTAQTAQTAAQAANQALADAHDAAEARLMKLTQDAQVQDSEVQALMEKLSDAEKALAETQRQKSQTESVVDKLTARLADELATLDGSPSEIMALVEGDPSYSGVDRDRLREIVDSWTNRKIQYQAGGGLAQSKFVNAARVWICYRRDSGQVIDHEILATTPVEESFHNSKWGATTPAFRFDAAERLKFLRKTHGLDEPQQIKREPLIVAPEVRLIDGDALRREINDFGFHLTDLAKIDRPIERDLEHRFTYLWNQVRAWREQQAELVEV